jgi:hypothetical protein
MSRTSLSKNQCDADEVCSQLSRCHPQLQDDRCQAFAPSHSQTSIEHTLHLTIEFQSTASCLLRLGIRQDSEYRHVLGPLSDVLRAYTTAHSTILNIPYVYTSQVSSESSPNTATDCLDLRQSLTTWLDDS